MLISSRVFAEKRKRKHLFVTIQNQSRAFFLAVRLILHYTEEERFHSTTIMWFT